MNGRVTSVLSAGKTAILYSRTGSPQLPAKDAVAQLFSYHSVTSNEPVTSLTDSSMHYLARLMMESSVVVMHYQVSNVVVLR